MKDYSQPINHPATNQKLTAQHLAEMGYLDPKQPTGALNHHTIQHVLGACRGESFQAQLE